MHQLSPVLGYNTEIKRSWIFVQGCCWSRFHPRWGEQLGVPCCFCICVCKLSWNNDVEGRCFWRFFILCLRSRHHGLTSLKAAEFQSTVPAAPLFPLCYGLCNSLFPVCQLCFSCSELSREFPFGFALTRMLLVLSLSRLETSGFPGWQWDVLRLPPP